ncbi:MAG: hypothetical protein QXY39_03460 [Thermofilaceae archaeon]
MPQEVVEIDGYRFIRVRLKRLERYYSAMKRLVDYVLSFPYEIDRKAVLDYAELNYIMNALNAAYWEAGVDVDPYRPLAGDYCIDDTSEPEKCKVVFFSEDYKGVMILKPEALVREDQYKSR